MCNESKYSKIIELGRGGVDMTEKIINNKRYFLYSTLSEELKPWYKQMLYRFLFKLNFEYRGFSRWYDGLFLSNYELNPEREIIICEVNYQLAAVSILKNQFNEKKICTLRVAKQFRNNGIGHELMELSFDVLNTAAPMITLGKSKFNQFESLLDYYGFRLEQVEKHYYNVLNTELVYNGQLPYNRFRLIDMFSNKDIYMSRYFNYAYLRTKNNIL